MFHTEQITFTKHLETLPLTKLEFPLHIWNAFSLSFKYPHFGGLGEKLHINKLDDSKYRVLRGELTTETKRTAPPVLPCSLLELQSPDMLRPASPPFGFLIVAANCAFQDFVLGRQDARGERETEGGEERKKG